MSIVEAVVPPDQLMVSAMGFARQIAAKSPAAIGPAKHALNRIEELRLCHGCRFEQNMTTELLHDEVSTAAMRAFLEIREPV